MKVEIEKILEKIHAEVNAYGTPSWSLMGGKSGAALFNLKYLQYTDAEGFAMKVQGDIQSLAENTLIYDSGAFCGGKAGICWLFTYMYRSGWIDTEDWRLVCNEDEDLSMLALKLLEKGNFDFLHGAIGIGHYLLYEKAKTMEPFFEEMFRKLDVLARSGSSGKIVPHFDFREHKIIPEQINLGLAHGLPSILKFCLECYDKDVCKDEAERLARNIVDFLIRHINADRRQNYFPSMVFDKGDQPTFSRLAWCYGDPGVGYVLYQAGQLLGMNDLSELAVDVLLHGCQRRETQQTQVFDAGICHGSAGIAYIFHKMFRLTGIAEFNSAGQYWIQRTLALSTFNDTISGYKKFMPDTRSSVPDTGLLEGSVGIGLVLLSWLTNDFSWDYCLMLN